MNSAWMCSVLRQPVGQPSRGQGKGPPRIRRRGVFAPPLVSTRRSPVDDLRRSLDASRRPPDCCNCRSFVYQACTSATHTTSPLTNPPLRPPASSCSCVTGKSASQRPNDALFADFRSRQMQPSRADRECCYMRAADVNKPISRSLLDNFIVVVVSQNDRPQWLSRFAAVSSVSAISRSRHMKNVEA